MDVINKYPNSPLVVVDWSAASSPPSAALSAQIAEILMTRGFFYVENVPGYSASALESTVKWFYGKSLDFKMQVARKDHNPNNANRYRGYKPIEPDLADGRTEIIELGGFDKNQNYDDNKNNTSSNIDILRAKEVVGGENPWPKPLETGDVADIQMFEETVKSHHALLSELGMGILSHLAVGLGLSSSTFEALFHPHPLSSLRMIHYPAPEIPPKETESSQSQDDVIYSGHTDSGCVTLLTAFDWGLQLLDKGLWYNVPPRKNAIICNIGDTLVRLTNGRVKATVHRVAKIGKERYSLPFFVEPKYDAVIRRLNRKTTEAGDDEESEDDEAVDWETIDRDFSRKQRMWYRYGPWMVQNLQRVEEFRMVNFGVI